MMKVRAIVSVIEQNWCWIDARSTCAAS